MFTLAHRGMGLDLMDRFEGAFSFVVSATAPQGGLIDMPVQATIARSAGGVSGIEGVASPTERSRA
jgi:hypothetical protein